MRSLILFLIAVLLAGCESYSTLRYASSVDNVTALRALNGNKVNVGNISSTVPGQSEIMCRGSGPIRTPNGEPFAEFVRKALLDELTMANIYMPTAPIALTGNLDAIEVTTVSGIWSISLTLNSSNGKSMSLSDSYKFHPGTFYNVACPQAAQAFMPAVQDLIGKIVSSPKFRALLVP